MHGIRTRAIAVVVTALVIAIAFSGAAAGQESTFDGMDGNGTAEDPYVVTNVDELQAINQDLDAHYVLGNDIDASETETWNTGRGFEPLTDNSNDVFFTGSFDGRNHTVTGLTIDRPSRGQAGLFGISTGTIENVALTDVSVTGEQSTGTVVGINKGTIREVNVSGTVEGDASTGGLVGSNYAGSYGNARIRDSGADVTVDGGEYNVGGLAGSQGNDGVIRRSFATGDVTGEESGVGGLVGVNSGEIRSSFATGDVQGQLQTGGLVGEGGGVTQSYATGTVTADYSVGGLIGWSKGEIYRSYTLSAVQPDDPQNKRYGAVVGRMGSPSVGDLYWNPDTASVQQIVGSGSAKDAAADAVTPLRTGAMTGASARDNFAAFNFGPAWTATDEYPVQRWAVENVSLSLADERLARGDSTTVTVTLELVDGRTVTATETASYELNNSIAAVEDTAVQTNETGTVTVSTSVAGQRSTETLRVLAPPNISATNVSVDSDLVARGVTVPIETTYVNTGDIAGQDTVSLRVDGETVRSVTLSGDPGEERTVVIDWRADSLGSYDIAVDDESAGTVEVVEPPELTTDSASVNVSAVTAGSSVQVSATIANDDRLRGERDTVLRVDDENVTRQRVSVGPGNETTTTFSWTPSGPGNYSLAVDGVSADSVTVVAADAVSVSNVSGPANATAGEAFSTNVTVMNTANVSVSERLTLTANGEQVAATWADLPANDTTTVSLSGIVENAGTQTLSASSTSSSNVTSLSVLEPASFAVTGIEAPSAMTAGQSASVNATVANQGGVAGAGSLTLSVAGETVTNETLSLAAGETATVSGAIAPSSAGETTVTAQTGDDNRTATVTVEAAPTPTATSAPADTAATGGSETGTSGGSGPGFGVAAAVVALLAGAALARRN